jgi:ectoine hydroxylase-related dioxygenase (phytanoyl-CoA dioxygenase family)
MTTAVLGLSADQRRAFDERGLVKLPRAIARSAAEEMAQRLWAELARRHHIHRRERKTWRIERPADLRAIQDSDAFRAMASPTVVAALDELMGRGGWERPPHWGQPLVCFPSQHRWDVPHKSWHLDLPAEPRWQGKLVGRIFAIVAPLEPQGGGTLVAIGSHRIVQALVDDARELQSSADMRRRLQSKSRWFADLMAPTRLGELKRIERFMESETVVDGVPLRVDEMTGEPGDVFFMHPAVLHAAAPNVLTEPRLVLSQFVMPKA